MPTSSFHAWLLWATLVVSANGAHRPIKPQQGATNPPPPTRPLAVVEQARRWTRRRGVAVAAAAALGRLTTEVGEAGEGVAARGGVHRDLRRTVKHRTGAARVVVRTAGRTTGHGQMGSPSSIACHGLNWSASGAAATATTHALAGRPRKRRRLDSLPHSLTDGRLKLARYVSRRRSCAM